MSSLNNKAALVTGASQGIGREIAFELAKEGAHVLIHYGKSENEAMAVVREIQRNGGSAQVISMDLEDADGPYKLAAEVQNIVKHLDILVANAGVFIGKSIEESSMDDFHKLFAVNVRAPFFLVQQLLPIMSEGSSITFISSLSARTAFGEFPLYAATKGAIDTLVKHFALALGSKGIRVNSVAPGIIDSQMTDFSNSRDMQEFALGLQALKRIAKPDDVAEVVRFLSSDSAKWITGDTIHVDGGSKL